jgi:hypothetical protein
VSRAPLCNTSSHFSSDIWSLLCCRDSLAGELLQEREDVARSRGRAQAAVEALQAANATLEDVPSELAATMASVQVR